MAAQTGFDQPQSSPDNSMSAEAGNLLDALSRARAASDLERLRMAIEQTGHAAMHWSVPGDLMTWSANAAAVVGLHGDRLPRSGEQLRALMPLDDRERYESVVLDSPHLDDGDGIGYDVRYRLVDPVSGEMTSIEERGRVVCAADGSLQDVIAVLRQAHDRPAEVASSNLIDPETGLASRPAIVNALRMEGASAANISCGLVVATMSNIADIRDTYGPSIVPEAIAATAMRLKSIMRGSDMLGRAGAAQFAILLRDCTSEQLQVAGDRFVAAIRNDVIETRLGPVWVELTAGGVIVPASAEDPASAFGLAEEALDEAECNSGRPFAVYQRSPQRLTRHGGNRKHAIDIIDALNAERFTLWHQPIVSSKDHQPAMFESLLRMQSPDGEIVPAAHLVPIADKLGFMQMIDAMVCRTSLDLLAIRPGVKVSFNLSDATLRNSYAAMRILNIVAEAGGVAKQICIEISHTAATREANRQFSTLQKLRELGCSLAVSGYLRDGLSIAVLKEADYVKLDGVTCAGISSRPHDLPLLKAAIEFAHRAGAQVIAEHVETEADASILAEIGVDYLQGFLFGKASPEHFDVTLSPVNAASDPADPETGTAADTTAPTVYAPATSASTNAPESGVGCHAADAGCVAGTAEVELVIADLPDAQVAGDGNEHDPACAVSLLKAALNKLDSI